MSLLLLLCALALLQPCLSHLQCDVTNNNLNNEFQVGKWNLVALFMPVRAKRHSCMPVEFKRVEDKYSYHCTSTDYTSNGTEYTFQEDCIEMLSGRYQYPRDILIGNKELKYFLSWPFVQNYVKGLRTFKKVNQDYVLYNECPNRFNYTALLSRIEEPNEEDLNAIIATIEEVKTLTATTYCFKGIVTDRPRERMEEFVANLKEQARRKALSNSTITN